MDDRSAAYHVSISHSFVELCVNMCMNWVLQAKCTRPRMKSVATSIRKQTSRGQELLDGVHSWREQGTRERRVLSAGRLARLYGEEMAQSARHHDHLSTRYTRTSRVDDPFISVARLYRPRLVQRGAVGTPRAIIREQASDADRRRSSQCDMVLCPHNRELEERADGFRASKCVSVDASALPRSSEARHETRRCLELDSRQAPQEKLQGRDVRLASLTQVDGRSMERLAGTEDAAVIDFYTCGWRRLSRDSIPLHHEDSSACWEGK